MRVLMRWFCAFFIAGAVALPLLLLAITALQLWLGSPTRQGLPFTLVTNFFIALRMPDGRLLGPLPAVLLLLTTSGFGCGVLGVTAGSLWALRKNRT